MKRYDVWAGNPKGTPENPNNCVTPIFGTLGSHGGRQCSRPRGHGPGGLYCKQHNPTAVMARRAASEERFMERFRKKIAPYTKLAACIKTLKRIAKGHPKSKELALKTLKEIEQ